MSFQVLVGIDVDEDLVNGLVLPVIFQNKISRHCKSIKLVNYRNMKFVVMIEMLRNKKLKLVGEQWKEFVNAFEFPDTTTLCFTWVKKTTFSVSCFDSNGMEFWADPVRWVTIHRCLAEVTEETFVGQELPHLFLVECNNRRRRCENLTAQVVGLKQASAVEVMYIFPENDCLGHAAGFQGSKWTSLCLENEIEVGHTVMFTDMRNLTFNLHLFTVNGVGVDIASLGDEEEGDDPKYSTHMMSDEEAEAHTAVYYHRCNHFKHRHKRSLPQLFKKFVMFTPKRKNLTIPKDFVRMHDLHTYNRALLYFGRLVFCVSLEIHVDRRRIEDKTHLVMVTYWDSFMQKTGVSEGKVLRFQMNVIKSIPGQLVDFDVC